MTPYPRTAARSHYASGGNIQYTWYSSNDHQIWCVNIEGYVVSGFIVGSDYHVLLCISMAPGNRRLIKWHLAKFCSLVHGSQTASNGFKRMRHLSSENTRSGKRCERRVGFTNASVRATRSMHPCLVVLLCTAAYV